MTSPSQHVSVASLVCKLRSIICVSPSVQSKRRLFRGLGQRSGQRSGLLLNLSVVTKGDEGLCLYLPGWERRNEGCGWKVSSFFTNATLCMATKQGYQVHLEGLFHVSPLFWALGLQAEIIWRCWVIPTAGPDGPEYFLPVETLPPSLSFLKPCWCQSSEGLFLISSRLTQLSCCLAGVHLSPKSVAEECWGL